jgi:hypothetical protein
MLELITILGLTVFNTNQIEIACGIGFKGCYYPETKVIYISDNNQRVLQHEIGHALFNHKYPSEKAEQEANLFADYINGLVLEEKDLILIKNKLNKLYD